MPNRKKADENAPSRKYFMAASCDSRRRRRASPHSRYSGSDSTSSATNMVSRSLAAGNSSIPPTANRVSGKISVCMAPVTSPSRSSWLPGGAAAWATNGLLLVSAMSSTLTKARTRIVPWMNRVGRSTATAPAAATWPGLPWSKIESDAITMVSTNAAASEPRVSTSWTARRSERGVKASTRTPTTAAPKTTSIGASWPYSMCGAGIAPLVDALPTDAASAAGRTPVTVRFPSARRWYRPRSC